MTTEQVGGQASGETKSPPTSGTADPATASVTFSSDAEIRAAMDKSPQLRSFFEKAKLDGRNEGVQTELARVRREAGSSDRVKAAEERILRRVAERLQVDESTVRSAWAEPDRKDFAYTFDLASERALHDLGQAWVAATAEHFGLDPATLTEGVTDPAQLAAMASELWTKSLDNVSKSRLGDLTLKDIPEASKLHAEIRDLVASEAAKEIKAREEEATAAGRKLPATPSGGAAGTAVFTREKIESMSPQEINANWEAIEPFLGSLSKP